MIFDGITAGEEDNHLLLQVLLEKGEKKKETTIGWAHDVTLG